MIRPGQARAPWVGPNLSSIHDHKVAVNGLDALAEYLEDKLRSSGGIVLTTIDKGGGILAVNIDGSGVLGDHKVLVDGTDTTAAYLASKLAVTTASGISLTILNSPGNESILLAITLTGANVGTGTGQVFKQKNASGNLEFKTIKAGTNITSVVNNTDDVTINADTQTGDHKVLNSGADTTANYLTSKIVAGTGVSLVTLNAGGNEQTQINVSTGGTTPQAIYAEVSATNLAYGPTVNNNFAALAGTYVVGSTRIDTASTVNGVITAGASGIRAYDGAISFRGSANTTWEFGIAVNGSVLTDSIQARKLGATGDVGALALTALHIANAGETVQIYARQVGATGGSITAEYVNLNEHMDLGDGTVRVSSDDTTAGYLEDKITVEGLQKNTESPAGDERLDISNIPGFEDLFYESKPFWVGTQAITSADFSVDTVNHRLNGLAQNNAADWIRTGIEGDFDYKIKIDTNGATAGGLQLDGNSISIAWKNVPGSNQLQRTCTGESTATQAYASTTVWLRITRIGRSLAFYYRANDTDKWSSVAGAALTKDIGYDVKLSLISMTNGRLHYIYLWDNSFPKRVRSAYGKQIPLTDGATITPDLRQGNLQTVTLGGNRTIANPTENQVNNGFMWVLRLRQDGTGSRTVSWGAKYRFPGGTTPTLTTAINKSDYFGFCYNSTDDKWDCIAQEFNL